MRLRWLLLLFVILLAVCLATQSLWLPALGWFLVRAEEPVHTQAVIVLAGDLYGLRVLRAAEVAKAGYAPIVYVSGPTPFYEHNEADLAIALAVRRGYPASLFEPVYIQADSTKEEAGLLLRHLQTKGVTRFLIVTSDFHTRRTTRIFRSLAPEADFHVVAARTEGFSPRDWWTSRPARKIFFMEWLKTVANWLGV